MASNLERLEALRELAGNTFVLTTGRSIVCIEGQNSDVTDPSDIRILELICPRATAYTFVPVGNKSSVISTVNQLRTNLPADVFKVNVFGVTDSDRGATLPAGIVSWPVCMIENFLIDSPALLATALALGSTAVPDQASTDALLVASVQEERDSEISLRLSRQLKAVTVRPKGSTIEAVTESITENVASLQKLVDSPTAIQAALNAATTEVDQILARSEGLKAFRGKALLRKAFNRLFPGGKVSYSEFVHRLALEVAKNPDTQAKLNAVFDALEQSVVQQPFAAVPSWV